MAAKNSVNGISSGEGDASGAAEVQRWTAGRKAAIVLDIIKGKATPADAARLHGLTVAEVEGWVDKFVEGGREGLRAVPRELEAKFDAERKDLLAKVGELTLQIDAMKKKDELARGPGGRERSGAGLVNAVVSAMRTEGKAVAVEKVCRWLGVPRSTAYALPKRKTPRRPRVTADTLPDGFLAGLIYALIQVYPTFGVRVIWSQVRFTLGFRVNRKRVARIMRREGWTVTKRRKGGRPRVKVKTSIAERPDERWVTDIALVHCGRDGWCALVPVIDCCTREILGWELSDSWRSRTAERALESALIRRFGYTRGAPPGLMLRHDNGLVFGSRGYIATVHDYGLSQEYITPYTPEENGLCSRFIRTIKEECVWQHNFASLEEARRVIGRWIAWYNTERPHSALKYLTPAQRRNALTPLVAAA